MNNKEAKWRKERCGYISASELKATFFGKKGQLLKSTEDYISQKRFERQRGYSLIKRGRALRIYKRYYFRIWR